MTSWGLQGAAYLHFRDLELEVIFCFCILHTDLCEDDLLQNKYYRYKTLDYIFCWFSFIRMSHFIQQILQTVVLS